MCNVYWKLISSNILIYGWCLHCVIWAWLLGFTLQTVGELWSKWNLRWPSEMNSIYEKKNVAKLSRVNCTFLNVSRVHKTFPNPRKVTGCCVAIINIVSIRCSSSGRKCHSLSQTASLRISNWLVMFWPKSQMKNIETNDQNSRTIGAINCIGSPELFDYFFSSERHWGLQFTIADRPVWYKDWLTISIWTTKRVLHIVDKPQNRLAVVANS